MKEKKLIKAAEVLASADKDKPVDWEKIARIVEYWIRTYPEEAKIFQARIKELRGQLYDPIYASSDGVAERRWVMTMPDRLDKLIKAFEPAYDSIDNIKTFLGRFPMFQIPEKL